MASLATAGIGAKFRRLNTSFYEDIAEVVSISGPSMARETIDVTSLDSTDGYREFIGSLRDGGSITLEMNFRRDTYDDFKTDFENDDLEDYEVIFPDDEHTSFNFQGLVTELGLETPVDDKISCTVTIKISGTVNTNSGSGSS